MSPRWSSRPAHVRIVAAGVLVILVLIVAHGVNAVTGDGRFLSVDQEQNLPTWLRTMLFAAAAAACLVCWRLGDRHRRLWLGLGVLMLAFSLDDAVMGHEWLEAETDGRALVGWWEPLAGLAIAAVFAAAVRAMPSPQRGLVLAAAVSLVGGQAASTLPTHVDLGHALVVLFSLAEQGLEALTGVFILAAAWGPARDLVTGLPGPADRGPD